jgi:hypothetical protein
MPARSLHSLASHLCFGVILFYSILFDSILFYSILFYSIRFDSIRFEPIVTVIKRNYCSTSLAQCLVYHPNTSHLTATSLTARHYSICILSLSLSSASVVRAVMSSVTGQRWQRCIGFLQSLIHDPPISDRELCLLTPFQQWRKYKHFPLVIILHFLVVLFITIQVPWHSWPST